MYKAYEEISIAAIDICSPISAFSLGVRHIFEVFVVVLYSDAALSFETVNASCKYFFATNAKLLTTHPPTCNAHTSNHLPSWI